MSQNIDRTDKTFEQSDEEDESPGKRTIQKFVHIVNLLCNLTEIIKDQAVASEASQDPAKEIILRTCRLFLRNLAFNCTEADLTELFQTFGQLSKVSTLPILCPLDLFA